ncbi:MAG: OmpA family protein [Saprospiraceae bacterium]
MKVYRFIKLLKFILPCFIVLSLHGQTNEFLLKQADGFFQNRQFIKAVVLYQQLQRINPKDESLKLKRAIAEYETNNLDTAGRLAMDLLKSNVEKARLAEYLYGKILMSKGKYTEAAAHFKQSLLHTPDTHELHDKLIDEIKRCGSGEILLFQPSQVLVESAGPEVNTVWDEMNPVPSINSESRIYFNSNRESVGAPGNTGDGFELPFDMYASNLTNGEWSDIGPLNNELNTKEHELLVDFSERGQVVYYKRGNRLADLKMITDTFSQNGDKRIGAFDHPYVMPQDEVIFFTDSIVLISSNRPGGYGNFDLYYSIRQKDTWTIPVNLGKSINTPYDEISPYLAFDGRTLVFSSNNTRSMGGFDFFTTYFNDRTKLWSAPANLGAPLNSSEDEKHFRITKSRLSALFDSNRKSGEGGYDIYFAYFNQAWVPQVERSRPVFFGLVRQDTSTNLVNSGNGPQNSNSKISLTVPTVFYVSDDQFELPSMTKQLDEVVRSLQVNQNVNVIVEVFSDKTVQSTGQNLLFSIKRAEIIKEYFINHGVKPFQVIIKAYGSNFPLAIEKLNDKPNPAGQSLNRRIEFTYYMSEPGFDKKFEIHKVDVPVNALIKSGELDQFRSKEKNLNYKTLIISASNPANLEPYISDSSSTFFIEKNNINGKYELMSDAQTDYSMANKTRKAWVAKGFDDAVVVAYIDNARIMQNVISKWTDIYPDLINYIYRSE